MPVSDVFGGFEAEGLAGTEAWYGTGEAFEVPGVVGVAGADCDV